MLGHDGKVKGKWDMTEHEIDRKGKDERDIVLKLHERGRDKGIYRGEIDGVGQRDGGAVAICMDRMLRSPAENLRPRNGIDPVK